VVVPNFVLQSVWEGVKFQPPAIIHLFIEPIINSTNTTAFKKLKVRELLFEGYEDQLLVQLCKQFPDQCKGKPTRIGLFYGVSNWGVRITKKSFQQNGTASKTYEVDTGIDDLNEISMVRSWNYSTQVNAWYGKEARRVHGRDGQVFPPIQKWTGDSMDIYVGDICRLVKSN
jgi:hypothetical protein